MVAFRREPKKLIIIEFNAVLRLDECMRNRHSTRYLNHKERLVYPPNHEPFQQLEFDLGYPSLSPRRLYEAPRANKGRQLGEAALGYLNTPALRRLAASGGELYKAVRDADPPPDVLALLDALSVLLTPLQRHQPSGR